MTNVTIRKQGGSSLATPEQVKAVAEDLVHMHTRRRMGVVVVVSARGQTTNEIRARIRDCSKESVPEEILAFGGQAGERESAACLAAAINALGVETRLADGAEIGLIADGQFGRGQIRTIKKPEVITDALEDGKIVVLAGYTGITRDGQTIDLGRSGTDTFAIAVAAAINAKVCQIATDVPGFFATDPRFVPNAKMFDRISFRQALSWVAAGIEVVKKECLVVADNLGVTIQVMLSPSFDPKPWLARGYDVENGTTIDRGADLDDMQGSSITQTILTMDDRITVFNVIGIPNEPGQGAKIFGPLSKAGIVVGEVAQGLPPKGKKANITFYVRSEDANQVGQILKNAKLGRARVERRNDLACIRLLDPRMVVEVGWHDRAIETLANAKVNIEITPTAGDVILMVVAKRKLGKAAQALAEEFECCQN